MPAARLALARRIANAPPARPAPRAAFSFPGRALAARLGDLPRFWAELLAMPRRPPMPPPEPPEAVRATLLRLALGEGVRGPDLVEALGWARDRPGLLEEARRAAASWRPPQDGPPADDRGRDGGGSGEGAGLDGFGPLALIEAHERRARGPGPGGAEAAGGIAGGRGTMRDDDLRPTATDPRFDGAWYATRYPDVALSGWTPWEHYRRIGARLGREPGPGLARGLGPAAPLPDHRDLAEARPDGAGPLGGLPATGPDGWGGTASGGAGADVSVDVVVPVHDALEDVRACLQSLARVPTGIRFRVLVVNDGSSAETTEWLRRAVGSLGGAMATFVLREHDRNRGYTVAVNTGLRDSRAPYVVTLNSDTIVTPYWLDGLVRCMRSDPAIGIVGPLSNAASWQNVPRLRAEDGSFAINALPPGIDPAAMAALVARASARAYPRIPFLNGFCYMIRREVIERIGTMDEAAFPTGYGEENDYSIRAQDAGFALAVADDTYVHHAKSRSFGTELSRAGSRALKAKHPPGRLAALKAEVRDTRVLDGIRARVRAVLDEVTGPATRTARDWVLAQKVLFLLLGRPGGGGTHSVVQEVAAMRRMGVTARVAVRLEHLDRFRTAYDDIPRAADLFVPYTPIDLAMIAARFDVIVATSHKSVGMVATIVETCPWVLPAYYIQDYEPLFSEPGSDSWHEARNSYALIPQAVLFAKTDWVRRQVEKGHGVAVLKVQASIDHDVYRPSAERRAGARAGVAAMIRPQTPRRGARRTMELLKRLKEAHGDRLTVRIFGCGDERAEYQALPRDFEFENLGVLTRPQVAALLRRTDLFVDLSDYQAFGRTALEAMACGALSLVPADGGSDEYAVDGVNALVADTRDVDACFARATEVLADRNRMSAMQLAALDTAAAYSPRRAASSELAVLAPPLARLRQGVGRPMRPRVTLLPALTEGKQGRSIAGTGYARVVRPYCQDAFAGRFDVTVAADGALPAPGSADLVLLQDDLCEEARPEFERWHRALRAAGGRLIYDIDDDLLDTEALDARGTGQDPLKLARRVMAYARAADVITTPTREMASRLPGFAPKVRVVPDRIDERLWNARGQAVPSSLWEVRPKGEGQVRIGYFGTPSRYRDMLLVQEAMERIQARYGTAVDIEVIGAFQMQAPLFGTSRRLPRSRDYPSFVAWVQLVADWDIAIVPVVEDRFNLAKGGRRLIESAALEVGIVASDIPEHREVARDGTDALLVPNTTEAWVAALSRLIDDPGLRRDLAASAQREVAGARTTQRDRGLYLSVLDAALEVGR